MAYSSSPSSFPGVRVEGKMQYDGEAPSVRREKASATMEARLPEREGWGDVPLGTRRERKQKAQSATERARQRILARQRVGGA